MFSTLARLKRPLRKEKTCNSHHTEALKPLMNPRKKVDLKLIIVGALGVGKTSLLHQYVHKTFFEEYQTTLGASILSKMIILDNTTLKLQVLMAVSWHLMLLIQSPLKPWISGEMMSWQRSSLWSSHIPWWCLGTKLIWKTGRCPRK